MTFANFPIVNAAVCPHCRRVHDSHLIAIGDGRSPARLALEPCGDCMARAAALASVQITLTGHCGHSWPASWPLVAGGDERALLCPECAR